MTDQKIRLRLSYERELPFPARDIFRLACPVKNDEWLPGWRESRCIVYTESGFAEPGCVFQVSAQPYLMGDATLVNSVYEPFRRVQYDAMNCDLVYQIHWLLEAGAHNGSTQVIITRSWTALTRVAGSFLAALSSEPDRYLTDLFPFMEHYLRTGRMAQP